MTLEEVEERLRAELVKLRYPCPDFHFDRSPAGDATPHIEGDGPDFDWVISERGTERERLTLDRDELLFTALKSMTCSMATSEELRTRTTHKPPRWRKARACMDDNYSRLTWMEAHERLMRFLRHDWGVRLHHHYDEILDRFPLTEAERRNARKLDLSGYGVVD